MRKETRETMELIFRMQFEEELRHQIEMATSGEYVENDYLWDIINAYIDVMKPRGKEMDIVSVMLFKERLRDMHNGIERLSSVAKDN